MIRDAHKIPREKFIGLYFYHDNGDGYEVWKIINIDRHTMQCDSTGRTASDDLDQFLDDIGQAHRDNYIFCDEDGNPIGDGVVFKDRDKFKKYRDRLLSV